MDLSSWDDTDSEDAAEAVRRSHLRAVPPVDGPLPLTWREHLIYQDAKGGKPKLVKHLANAVAVLRYHPQWAGRIRLDEHAHRIYITDPPWHEPEAEGAPAGTRQWCDEDESRIAAWLLREIGLELAVRSCGEAGRVVAAANRFHPFRDWCDGLVWDGVDRLDAWLIDHLGVTPSDYVAAVGKWWLISAVARTYAPGCKADYVLVLEGAQGLKKSTALKLLASQRYFSDSAIHIGNKDAYQRLPGKVIVELAEFKLDSKAAKDFFSSSVDDYRPPYGRNDVRVPRGCIFASTVNPEGSGAYLTDETGGRRFWPVACGEINLETLQAAREQMWAEAVTRYKRGERWWPDTPEEHAMCGEEQADRTEAEPWEEPIASWLALHPGDVGMMEVLKGALSMEAGKVTRKEQQRAARALKENGYRRVQVREGARRTWVYRKG